MFNSTKTASELFEESAAQSSYKQGFISQSENSEGKVELSENPYHLSQIENLVTASKSTEDKPEERRNVPYGLYNGSAAQKTATRSSVSSDTKFKSILEGLLEARRTEQEQS